jgi:broad specificity phosphatase PhoE
MQPERSARDGTPASMESVDGKLLCLIRHGQGKHNPRVDLRFLYHLAMVRDPELTALGVQQAQARAARLRAEGHTFDAIVVSPLSRAIQTCHLVFGSGTTPIRLCPLLTERCCSVADVGTPKSELRERRPECSAWDGWDEADFEEQWWPTRTLSQAEYWPLARVQRLKDWLLARPERSLALVGHKGLMQCLTAGADLPNGHRLGNCEAFWVRLHADGRVCPLYATSAAQP